MRSINIISQDKEELPYISTVIDYFELMKPKVMSLVIFTTVVGMYLAPNHLHPVLALV